MSTNVRFIKTLSGSLTVPAANVDALIALDDFPTENGGPYPPETWIGSRLKLDRARRARWNACVQPNVDLMLTELRWDGDFSGATWLTVEDSVMARFLDLTTGRAEFLVVWEDGELTGLRVSNGTWELMDVEVKLISREITRLQVEQETTPDVPSSLYPDGPEDERLL